MCIQTWPPHQKKTVMRPEDWSRQAGLPDVIALWIMFYEQLAPDAGVLTGSGIGSERRKEARENHKIVKIALSLYFYHNCESSACIFLPWVLVVHA